MATRLLARQSRLLDHLTSVAAIFGSGRTPRGPALRGIDATLLRLEARFSYEKRMEKIAGVFPRTLALLAARQAAIGRGFAAACPPVDIGRLYNARQFHDFLAARWRRRPPSPRYLADVAALELAYAEARSRAEGEGIEEPGAFCPIPGHGIRRQPGAVLLRCRYDIRELFEAGRRKAAPARRDTPLAILVPPGADEPEVLGLPAAVFELVAALDGWTDPAAFGEAPALIPVIHDLARRGLLEVRL